MNGKTPSTENNELEHKYLTIKQEKLLTIIPTFIITLLVTLMILAPFIKINYEDTQTVEQQTTYVTSGLFDEPVDNIAYAGQESDQLFGKQYNVFNVTVNGQNHRVKVYDEALSGEYRTDIEPWSDKP